MANGYPRDEAGLRVILGMAPGKYDDLVITYDGDGNIATVTYAYAGNNISKLTLTWSSGNLVRVQVGAP